MIKVGAQESQAFDVGEVATLTTALYKEGSAVWWFSCYILGKKSG